MPVEGQAATQEAEDQLTVQLQAGATANGNGSVADFTGYSGAASLEVINTGTGTCTLTLQGSFDGVNWYAVGSMQVDGISSPARAAAGIGVTASPFAHVYSLLDTYNLYRAVISAAAGSLICTATLRGVPV